MGGSNKTTSSSSTSSGNVTKYSNANALAASKLAPTEVYGGQRVADQSGQTQGGLAALTGLAGQNMNGLGLSGQYQSVIDNGGYNAAQQGALANTQQLANSQWGVSPELQRILDQSNEAALGSVNLANSASGRYGSGMGNAAVADAVSRNTNNLVYQDYNNFNARKDAANNSAFQMGQTGFGNLGTAFTGAQAPANTLLGVGSQQDAYQQALINANIDRFDETQAAPRNDISFRQGIYGGAGQLGSTTTTKAPGQSSLLTGLGYAASGAGLLGGFF